MYRQSLAGHDLSIEQGTSDVPDDGFYHVLHDGKPVGRYRSLSQATRKYAEIRKSLVIVAAEPPAQLTTAEMLQREMAASSNKSLIWDEDDFRRVQRMTQGKPKRR